MTTSAPGWTGPGTLSFVGHRTIVCYDKYVDEYVNEDKRDSVSARLLECCNAWLHHVAMPMRLVDITVRSLVSAYLRVEDGLLSSSHIVVSGYGSAKMTTGEVSREAAYQYLVYDEDDCCNDDR